MMMFLTILFTSIPVLVLSYVFFAGVSSRTRAEEKPSESRSDSLVASTPSRFFAGEAPRGVAEPRYPLDVLLSQIERHVRIEQAAAETFLDVPTPEALHSRTASPLMN